MFVNSPVEVYCGKRTYKMYGIFQNQEEADLAETTDWKHINEY